MMMTKNEIMNAMINLSEKECDELLDSLLSRKERRAAAQWLMKRVNKLPQEDKEDFTVECLSDLTEEGFKNVVTTYYKDNYKLAADASYAYGVFVTKAKNIKESGINRDLNKEVLKGLSAALKENGIGYIKGIPVLVYFDKDLKEYCLIDGHHRRYVLENFDGSIYFTVYKMGQPVSKEEARKVMMDINRNQRQWMRKNYEQSFLKSENENYVRMNEMEVYNKKKYGLLVDTVRAAIFDSFRSSGNGPAAKAVKGGYIEVTEENVRVAQKKIDRIVPIVQAMDEYGYLKGLKHKDRCINSVLAISVAMEILFDVEHCVEAVKTCRCPFQEQDNIDQFVDGFLSIYNYKLKKSQKLDKEEVKLRMDKLTKNSENRIREYEKQDALKQVDLVASIREN